MKNDLTIFVSEVDVTKWSLFQQYYEPFSTILHAGVFDIRNGNAVLHFGADGILQTIERGDILYSRKHAIV